MLAKQSELQFAVETEIENLKLLVFKLKRMKFGPRSEKLNADIEQLELLLEDLEASQCGSRATAHATGCDRNQRVGSTQACPPSASR